MIKKLNYKSCIFCIAIASIFLLTDFDKNICRFFLADRKINVDVENVLLVKGVNSAESELAVVREKIAEAVLMLNEFGTDKIVFDFDLSKKSSDNIFFDADSYLGNCLKIKKNIFSSSEVSGGFAVPFDYKNIRQIDETVIESVKEKLEESSSVDCDVFFELKKKENAVVKILSEMEDSGYFEYTPEYTSPYASSVDFMRKKELLFEKLDSSDAEKNRLFEEYVESKEHFCDTVLMFINGSAKELLSESAEDDFNDIDIKFSELEKCYRDYSEQRNLLKQKVEKTTCVFAPDDIVYNLTAVLFCFKSFAKTVWWWVSVIIALVFVCLCDYLCGLTEKLTHKILICSGFIVFIVSVSYLIFYFTGIYTGLIVPLVACSVLLVCEILICMYKGKFEKADNCKFSAGKNNALLYCTVESYSEIEKDFASEKECFEFFTRYYDLILKTAENFGGKKSYCEKGCICIEFIQDADNDIFVDICKAAIKIRSVISRLNAKLIKDGYLQREIFFDVKTEMVI